MTTTPEQIAKWTVDFEEWFATQLTVAGIPRHIQQGYALHGYLRAKQETEQAIKDARKQALEEAIAICQGIPYQGDSYMEGISACEAAIKELLND